MSNLYDPQSQLDPLGHLKEYRILIIIILATEYIYILLK